MRGEDTVDQSNVIRWLKIFCSSCNTPDDQAMSSKLRNGDFKAMIQVIETNPVSSTRSVSGELRHHDLAKVFRAAELCLTYYQDIAELLTQSSGY